MEVDLPVRPVTAAQLRSLRSELAAVRAAAQSLGEWGHDVTPATLARIRVLRFGSVSVLTSCVLCQQEHPVPCKVAGSDVPRAVICQDCDERVDAGIAIPPPALTEKGPADVT